MARKTTDYIIIHCAATRATHNVDIKEVDRWHREKGWRMVGYHFFIKRDGTIQTGRPLMDGGAHAGPEYNNRSVGICLAGGVGQDGKTPEANYTEAQWKQLKSLVEDLKKHNFPDAEVIGHNHVATKDCPCFDVKAWWSENN